MQLCKVQLNCETLYQIRLKKVISSGLPVEELSKKHCQMYYVEWGQCIRTSYSLF